MKNRLVQHDNWATPKEVYDKLNEEFNFDYDPCPLDFKEDGTKTEWKQSNFINPPYSRKLKEAFILKAFEESKKGKVCVMLLPVSTSTKIFHEVIYPNAEIRFWKGRINFLANGIQNDKYKSGQMDSMIIIFNCNENKCQCGHTMKEHKNIYCNYCSCEKFVNAENRCSLEKENGNGK